MKSLQFPILNNELEPRNSSNKPIIGLFFVLLFFVLLGIFTFLIIKNKESGGVILPFSANNCSYTKIEGISQKVIYCEPKIENKIPAIIAVSGWGSTAKSTQNICEFFVKKDLICLALDSANSENRSEEDVIRDVDTAFEFLKNKSLVDAKKISFWGGSNGALTTLVAAAKNPEVFSVLSLSPPLFSDFDQETMAGLKNLNTNLFYIFGETDYTDEATAKVLVETVKAKGKNGDYKIILGAGHNICCYNLPLLKEQYNFFASIIKQ